MRIAYVFDPILPQTETDTEQALNTVSALGRRGAEVVMFLPRGWRSSPTAEGLRDYYKLEDTPRVVFQRSLYPVPEVRIGSVSPSRAIEKLGHAARNLVNRQLKGFDLVYTRNVPVIVAALAAGHKVVYETYRPWPEQIPALGLVFKGIMSHSRFLGAVLHSAYAKDVFQRQGVAGDSLEVVHNGYWPRLFEPRLSKSEARRKLGFAEDRPLVLYAGRVNAKKGLGLVLDAASQMPDVDFAFVGSEGRGEIEERAAAMDNVHVFGWTSFDQLPPYLFAADVLLIPPSLGPLQGVGNTVLPMKLFLYLAAERPLLAPRAPDTAEILRHDHNAWLVEPDDVQTTIDGIRALTDDPERASRLAANAAELATGLTWEARADKVLAFIARRLAAKP